MGGDGGEGKRSRGSTSHVDLQHCQAVGIDALQSIEDVLSGPVNVAPSGGDDGDGGCEEEVSRECEADAAGRRGDETPCHGWLTLGFQWRLKSTAGKFLARLRTVRED